MDVFSYMHSTVWWWVHGCSQNFGVSYSDYRSLRFAIIMINCGTISCKFLNDFSKPNNLNHILYWRRFLIGSKLLYHITLVRLDPLWARNSHNQIAQAQFFRISRFWLLFFFNYFCKKTFSRYFSKPVKMWVRVNCLLKGV